MPGTAQILDIGCGAGQSLLAAYPGRVTFGIDIDLQALEIGRALTEEVKFTCGRAENLPFRDAFFDAVISRVALPYTNMPVSLREIRRVVKQNGTLWMTVHSFAVPWRVVKRTGLKGKIYFLYILVNSLLFNLFGRQFPFLHRYESFQTGSGLTRVLRRTGFTGILIERGAHFVVKARAE